MPRNALAVILPLLPILAGVWLSAGRFRAHEPLAGIAWALGGILLFTLLVFRLPGASGR